MHEKLSKDLHFFIEESFRRDPDAKDHYEEFREDYWKQRYKSIMASKCK